MCYNAKRPCSQAYAQRAVSADRRPCTHTRRREEGGAMLFGMVAVMVLLAAMTVYWQLSHTLSDLRRAQTYIDHGVYDIGVSAASGLNSIAFINQSMANVLAVRVAVKRIESGLLNTGAMLAASVIALPAAKKALSASLYVKEKRESLDESAYKIIKKLHCTQISMVSALPLAIKAKSIALSARRPKGLGHAVFGLPDLPRIVEGSGRDLCAHAQRVADGLFESLFSRFGLGLPGRVIDLTLKFASSPQRFLGGHRSSCGEPFARPNAVLDRPPQRKDCEEMRSVLIDSDEALGSETFQLRAMATTRSWRRLSKADIFGAFRSKAKALSRPSQSSRSSASAEITGLRRTQAEYFFDRRDLDRDPSEWLWHLDWKARLRRPSGRNFTALMAAVLRR